MVIMMSETKDNNSSKFVEEVSETYYPTGHVALRVKILISDTENNLEESLFEDLDSTEEEFIDDILENL